MNKKYIFILLYCILFIFNSFSNQNLVNGIKFYQDEMYNDAISSFHNIVLDPNNTDIHGDAYFWLAKSYFILDRLDDTERNLEYFLLNYEYHQYYEQAFYLKGRLLFKQQEYDNAILVFKNYIELYPDSSFISHSYFWIGESLFLLGNMNTAMEIFQIVVQDYPNSVKYEAANYRLSLINIKHRENELLLLLKISHEESLETLEEYQRLIQTYEQAVLAYQKQLSGKVDLTQSVTTDESLAQKDVEINNLKQQIEKLENQLACGSSSSPLDTNTNQATLNRLLQAKENALILKEYLMDYLD